MGNYFKSKNTNRGCALIVTFQVESLLSPLFEKLDMRMLYGKRCCRREKREDST
jgi:hypothetical protein